MHTEVFYMLILKSKVMALFQINARTELALRYNDMSPLENHHCAIAFEILEKVGMTPLCPSCMGSCIGLVIGTDTLR